MAVSKSYFVNSSSGLDPHLPVRPQRKRHALSDATNWVNNQSSSPQPGSSTYGMPSYNPDSDAPSITHYSSLHPGGLLQNPNELSPPPSKIEDKRVSAVSSEEARASNRLSQASQTSTNASGTNGKGRRKTHVGPWRLGRTIGKGASGRVRKARHATTGQDAAIKIVSKKSAEVLRSQSLAFIDAKVEQGKRAIPFGIEREVVIMKMIEHPNIVRLFDIWENRGELYLVLEYVEGGELFNHISSSGGLAEHEAVRIFRQIIAALAYCHQFSICHRDLKPENILMDRNKNIKIVDFGMAALQPINKWLETPCGSPHYASPEVIRAEPYRGDKADIWSCGVILFAMLAGFLPFDAHTDDWRDVIHAVLECDYKIPEWLSPDAQDLIWRILQPDPKRRMSIKHMWEHPLVKKYAHLDSPCENGNSHIGPPVALTIHDCGPRIKRRADIDGELLRNLHNLWHGATEDELARKLLGDKPNHEKIVYYKLLRYREEQLEHYEGPPLEASISDYHHVNPPGKVDFNSSTRVSLKSSQSKRCQSQYSLADHHLQSLARQGSHAPERHASVAETEKTVESYDPFRPSRSQIAKTQADHARIIVLRQNSSTMGQRPSTSGLRQVNIRNTRLPRSQQVEDAYSIANSPPTMHSSSASQLQRTLANQRRLSRGNSKVTMSSVRTGRSGSSQFVVRRPASYKRNVSFNRNRKRSISNGQPHLRSQGHQSFSGTLQERFVRDQIRAQSQPRPDSPSFSPRESPMQDAQPAIRSKKEGERAIEGRLASKLRQNNKWTDDVRKVSTELDKLCDTAFNRVSVSSSAPTAITPGSCNRESQGRQLSSATSFSIYEDPDSEADDRQVKIRMKDVSTKAYQHRPLPLPPTMDPMAHGCLESYTQRELAKTRDLLKKRNRASYMEPGYLDDVIAHLDRLMQPSNIRLVDEDRRAVTDPKVKSGLSRRDTFEQILENGNIGFRSASEPNPNSNKRQKTSGKGQSFRVVEDILDGYKSMSPIKPLTIRKKSGTSSTSPSPTSPTRQAIPLDKSRAVPSREDDNGSRPDGVAFIDKSLGPIKETEDFDPADRIRRPGNSSEPQKRSWFRSRHQPKLSKEAVPPPPPAKDFPQVYDCRQQKIKNRVSATSNESQTSERKKAGKGGRFFKMFTGKRDSKDSVGSSGGGDYNLNDGASFETEESSLHYRSRELQVDYLRTAYSQDDEGSAMMLERKKSQYDKNGNKSTNEGQSGEKNHRAAMAPPPKPPAHPSTTQTRPIQQRAHNWLARFLGIKPAIHVLCFQVSKLRARKEITGVFREWKKFGMRDVVVDKIAGRVSARVDGNNSLHIAPLSLAAEVHTLLHHSRRANLAIARFTQEKGAKSSFERVMRALEGLLKERGLLVEDEVVVREMRRGAGL